MTKSERKTMGVKKGSALDKQLKHIQKRRHRTKMVHWRSDDIEFGTGENSNNSAQPPWYILRLTGDSWDRPWYWWLDYQGPPYVYLTRWRAEARAKELRKQFSCKVEVVKLMPQ